MTHFEISIAHGSRSPAQESRCCGDFFYHAFLSTALQLIFHRLAGVVRSPAEIRAPQRRAAPLHRFAHTERKIRNFRRRPLLAARSTQRQQRLRRTDG
jgi:hypothetical protein